VSNRNAVLSSFRRRWQAAADELADARRAAQQAFAAVKKDMASAGFTKADLAGVRLAVRRSSETETQRASRLEAEQIAAALAEFGE
jgi:hypothetical protein